MLCLRGCMAEHLPLTGVDKFIQSIGFDVLFGFETHVAFDIDLNPESLAIKTVLVSRLMALHGFESLKEIFVGPSPCVVNTHRVIGGDWTIDETPAGSILPQCLEFMKNVAVAPEA